MTFEQFTQAAADLARPFSIYSTSIAAAWTIIDVGSRVGGDRADTYVGAVLLGLAGLYGFKAWEKATEAKHASAVEQVRAQSSPPPAEALKPPAPESERSLEDPA